MKKIEKLAEMIDDDDDPLLVADSNCPHNFGMKDSECRHFIGDKKSCYRCWMEEVEEVEE